MKTYQTNYTIIDGSFEYADSLIFQHDGDKPIEQAFREIAEFFSFDDEQEEQTILKALQTNGEAMIDCRLIQKVWVKEIKPIVVIVRGGVIQDISNIPTDLVIRVQDYDVEGDENLSFDEDGSPCFISDWAQE